MRLFGLIGYPLGHSFSAGYFTEKFKKEGIPGCEYRNFPIENINMFPQLFEQNPDFVGMNVTIPYKEQVMPFLNELDEGARAIGAVNCIKISKNKDKTWLKGYNTDAYGFEKSLKPLLSNYHRKALILGTGGASKAIKYILTKLGISYVSASILELKENEITYKDISKQLMNECLLIINATPLGTYPNIDTCPDIPYEYITQQHVMFDLVYNPMETTFMKKGLERGATAKNGLEMLHGQAEKNWEVWNS